jgi:hypothetical protein
MARDEVSSAAEDWAARRRAILAGRHWSSPNGLRPRWRHRLFSTSLKLFGLGLRLTPLQGRGLRNALDLELVELEMPLAGLPAAFDGYRILHVSDTHLDVLPAVADAAARLLDGLEVDLLVLTGDVHGFPHHALRLSVEPLARALTGVRVRERRLAVLGNHDPVEMVQALQPLGFETLVNRSTTLTRGGETVHVTGLDDAHSFYSPAARIALERPQDGFRSPWCTRPRWPITRRPRAMRSISAATPMAARFACRMDGRSSASWCAVGTAPPACGGRKRWWATPRQALACRRRPCASTAAAAPR